VQITPAAARDAGEIERAIIASAREANSALIVLPSAVWLRGAQRRKEAWRTSFLLRLFDQLSDPLCNIAPRLGLVARASWRRPDHQETADSLVRPPMKAG